MASKLLFFFILMSLCFLTPLITSNNTTAAAAAAAAATSSETKEVQVEMKNADREHDNNNHYKNALVRMASASPTSNILPRGAPIPPSGPSRGHNSIVSSIQADPYKVADP